LKWTVAKDGNYATSTCGRYIVNWTESKSQFQAVRLGKPDRGAWIGSVSLCVGTKAECVKACEVDGESNP
jgi:hypothetical protein